MNVNSSDDVNADFAKGSPAVNRYNKVSSTNEEKLSQKAQNYLKELRSKYANYDFMIGNGADELRSLSKNGSKEFSVIFTNAELERMANDEDYAAEKMNAVENSVDMCRKICEQQGYVSECDSNKFGAGMINKVGVVSDDNGNMKFFAELEKTSEKLKERLEQSKDKKAYGKRTTIEAKSYNELIDMLDAFDWSK